MQDTTDFEGLSHVDKEKPVVGDAEPEFVAPIKRFHVTLAGASEAIQRDKNVYGSFAVDGAHRFWPARSRRSASPRFFTGAVDLLLRDTNFSQHCS